MINELVVFDDRRCEVGEGPHFDERTGRVWWVDVLAGRVHWRTFPAELPGSRSRTAGPAAELPGSRSPTARPDARLPGNSDDHATHGELPAADHVSAAVPTSEGCLVIGLPAGLALLRADGRITPLATFPPTVDGVARRANDAKADPFGRLWVGTMAYDGTPHAGALYRLDAGSSTLVAVAAVTVSNGLGWSPDARTMYYIDTPTKKIDTIPYGPDGPRLAERRTFARIDGGSPDGLCVDADGGVWVALWGGGAVRRYTPDGALDRVIELPTPQVSSCAFAGPELDTLIITTAARGRPDDPHAGLTYACRPGGVRGLPVDRWRR